MSLPGKEDDGIPLSRAYLSRTAQIRQSLLASRNSLEHLIVHEVRQMQSIALCLLQCQHTVNPEWELTTSSLLGPLQKEVEGVAFPALRHLQVGPKTCSHCAFVVLGLFLSRKYDKTTEFQWSDGEKTEYDVWDIGSNAQYGYAAARSSESYESVAAPGLVSLRIHLPELLMPPRMRDLDVVRSLLENIQGEQIEMLDMWIGNNDTWGGLGVNGTSMAIKQRQTQEVEKELTRRAEEALKRERQRGTSNLLTKFQREAKELLDQQRKLVTDERARCSKSSVKPSAQGEEGKTSNAGTFTECESSASEKGEVKLEQPDDPSSDTSEEPVPVSAVSPMGTASATSEERKNGYDRVRRVAQSHAEMNYTSILNSIASKLPNLVGLSLRRHGSFHPDIVQDGNSDYSIPRRIFAKPLCKLDKLKFLDLDLAICGERELTDFPLGLNVHKAPSALAKIEEKKLSAAKRKIYDDDVAQAVSEGDAWRREVLGGMVYETPVETARNDKDAGAQSDAHSDSGSISDSDSEAPTPAIELPTWPKGVQSGHVYTIDLHDRRRHRGLLIPWYVQEGELKLGKAESIKL